MAKQPRNPASTANVSNVAKVCLNHRKNSAVDLEMAKQAVCVGQVVPDSIHDFRTNRICNQKNRVQKISDITAEEQLLCQI